MLSVDPDVTTGVSYEETWADPGFFHKKSGGRGVGGRRGCCRKILGRMSFENGLKIGVHPYALNPPLKLYCRVKIACDTHFRDRHLVDHYEVQVRGGVAPHDYSLCCRARATLYVIQTCHGHNV